MSFETAAAKTAAPDQCRSERTRGCVSNPVREGSKPDGRNPHQAGFGSREPGPALPGALQSKISPFQHWKSAKWCKIGG